MSVLIGLEFDGEPRALGHDQMCLDRTELPQGAQELDAELGRA